MIKKKTKKPIAIIVSRRTTGILLLMFFVLLAVAFVIVSTSIRTNTEKTSENLVRMLSDAIKEESDDAGVPIDVDHSEISIRNCNDMCERYDIEYAFVLLPQPEENKFTYICLSCKDKKLQEQYSDYYSGYVTEYEYSKTELDLWYAAEEYSHIMKDNHFGHEMITETIVEDLFGNRVSVGVDVDKAEVYSEIYETFALIGVLLLCVITAVAWALRRVIEKQVSVPAERISGAMQNFVANGKIERSSFGEMESKEYEMIANSFETMSENIDKYVSSIAVLTKENAQQQMELDVASKIQQGFLPKGTFKNGSCSISAMMRPAKDVAGDLYDYEVLDENRTLIVIADVSGKGIAASLFMAVTLTLIHQFAELSLSPDKILQRTNDALVSKNPKLLFTTAFVGIYDHRTGILSYSNAGHCIPYIAGSGVRTLTGGSGIMLGLYGNEEYTCAEEKLAADDILFLYTDGVTEAMNKDNEMFGEHRLENVLLSYRASGETDLVKYVCDAVDAYTGECEPHDDITMITLTGFAGGPQSV